MSSPSPDFSPAKRITHEAAAWILRCDRGLTPAEQDAFSDWLAADPRHGEQLSQQRQNWQRLDRLALWRPEHGEKPNPDLLAPPTRARVLTFLPYAAALAAAAAVALLLWHGSVPAASPRPATAAASAAPTSSTRTLPDGTIVELKRGAELAVAFIPGERRVLLANGEAHFTVTKDPTRPFIVAAAGVEVRAVGTAFNVHLGTAAVEVLVTEGKVAVAPAARAAASPPSELTARQRVVVSLGASPAPPQVDTLTSGEIERVLAWQHRVVDFTARPLGEVIGEFNRRNIVQLRVADPELAAVKISASFRTDNVDGFVHLLEAGFNAEADRTTPELIVLHRAKK